MPTQLPASVEYGKVVGRILLAVGDTPIDEDHYPDAVVPEGARITFTPVQEILVTEPPALVIKQTITCGLDSSGWLHRLPVPGEDPVSVPAGVWLVSGQYRVSFRFPGSVSPKSFLVQVTSAYTDDSPLDLTTVMPAPSGPSPIPQWQYMTQEQFDALPVFSESVLYLIGDEA